MVLESRIADRLASLSTCSWSESLTASTEAVSPSSSDSWLRPINTKLTFSSSFVIWPTNGAIVAVNRSASSMFGEAAVDQKVGWKLGRCHWMAREGVSSSWSMCRKLRGMGQQKSKQKKEQKIIAYLEVPKIMEVVQWLENQPQKPKSSPWDHLNSKAEWECPQRWQRWCLRNRNHSLSFLQRRNGRSARRGSGIAFFTVPGAILK